MKLIKKIKNILNIHLCLEKANQNLLFALKREQLEYSAYNCKEKGVSEKLLCENEVVVSLTTFGSRIYDVYLAIESIMQGSIKPNHIILWLDESFKQKKLPEILRCQERRGLEICYCKDLRSYKKLIPSLKKYPEACIITIDDDVIYNRDIVENLVNSYISNPKNIQANRIHKIVLNSQGKPISYMQWKWNHFDEKHRNLNFFTGIGGVLYPPHCFNEEVFNENVFMNICKYADDIWFFAMALYNGVYISKSYTHSKCGQDYLLNEDVQDIGLSIFNAGVNGCRNDEQIKAVFDRYNLYNKLIK